MNGSIWNKKEQSGRQRVGIIITELNLLQLAVCKGTESSTSEC